MAVDSLRPRELKSTRLLCPWDSPGRNTGVGSHSLLQRIFHDLGVETESPALQADSLASESPGKPKYRLQLINNVVLFSGVQQGESVIHIYVSFL